MFGRTLLRSRLLFRVPLTASPRLLFTMRLKTKEFESLFTVGLNSLAGETQHNKHSNGSGLNNVSFIQIKFLFYRITSLYFTMYCNIQLRAATGAGCQSVGECVIVCYRVIVFSESA